LNLEKTWLPIYDPDAFQQCRYLNATGLIWENAPAFGALIVFAEHRYYGVSKPFKKTLKEHMQFLTSEQAMADYAELITELKHDRHAESSAVIGFGGSYGMPFRVLALRSLDATSEFHIMPFIHASAYHHALHTVALC
jgi:hypothetical protein